MISFVNKKLYRMCYSCLSNKRNLIKGCHIFMFVTLFLYSNAVRGNTTIQFYVTIYVHARVAQKFAYADIRFETIFVLEFRIRGYKLSGYPNNCILMISIVFILSN